MWGICDRLLECLPGILVDKYYLCYNILSINSFVPNHQGKGIMFSIYKSRKINTRVRNVLLIVMLMLMFTTSLASAADDGTTLTLTRLDNTKVGILIVFPNGISGEFGGLIYPHYFDCETYPPDTIYCIATLPYWVDAATLHIFGIPGGDVVFSEIISVPRNPGEPDELPPPPPPSEECSDCQASPR
jgi:hypothetical protein